MEGQSPKIKEFFDLSKLFRLPPISTKVHFPMQLRCAPVSGRKTDLPGSLMWKLIDVEPDLLFMSLLPWGDVELSHLVLA